MFIHVLFQSVHLLSLFGASSQRWLLCIFVKKHEDGRATASWPYDSEGTPVEVPHA